MKKIMKNLLAVFLMILIMLLVLLRNKNISKAISVGSIGVEILENGQVVDETLKLIPDGEDKIKEGKKYEEKLQAYNTGSIGIYARAIVEAYWFDENMKKVFDTSLDNAVELNILENNGWFIDESATTVERTVIYYENILPPGEATPPFMDSFTIDNNLKNKYEVIKNGDNVQIVGKYDGFNFEIYVEVNAVQTHNAKDAIKSAWNVDVNIDSSGKLTLV